MRPDHPTTIIEPIAAAQAEAALVQAPRFSEIVNAAVELTKPRITRLVTITSAVGLVLSAVANNGWSTASLSLSAAGCLAGTALSSGGANALNEWVERDLDALMRRTCARPLPTNRLSPRAALLAGLILCTVGVLILGLACGPASSLVALVTVLVYVLVYTPLKTVSPVATLVGAIPGALPPLIGWTAVQTSDDAWFGRLLEPGGWSFFALMFVWQIPHFLAIAWMYREDYRRAGYRMLPQVDRTGRRMAVSVLGWAAALIPASLAPCLALPHRLSAASTIVCLVSGALYLLLATRFAICLWKADDDAWTRTAARRVFLGSIVHLPLLLVAFVADALVVAALS